MTFNTIGSAWEEFSSLCLDGASPLQVAEMKKAFYMGTASMLSLVYDTSMVDELSEEAAAMIFEGWRAECDMFVASEMSGVDLIPGEYHA